MEQITEIGNIIFDKAESFTTDEYVKIQNLLKKVYDHVKNNDCNVERDPFGVDPENSDNIVWRLVRWYEREVNPYVYPEPDIELVRCMDIFDNMNFNVVGDLSEIHIKFSRPHGEAYGLMTYIDQHPVLKKYVIQSFIVGSQYPFSTQEDRNNFRIATERGNAVVIVKLDMSWIIQ